MQKRGCHGPHPKQKTILFAEITKPDHKLLKPFYSNKISFILAEWCMFFYFMWCFFAKECHFQPWQLCLRGEIHLLAHLLTCFVSNKKFSEWVYWKVFCHFWRIKPCDLSHMVLVAPIFPGTFFYHSFYRVLTWSGKSGKVRQFVRGSGKVREIGDFLEKLEKSGKKIFIHMQFFNFNKKTICMCSWIIYYNQFYIWCHYLHLVLRWFF